MSARWLWVETLITASLIPLRVVPQGGASSQIALKGDVLRDLAGLRVPFFGRPAPSTPFPALLARARGVPLFAGAMIRRDGVCFEAEMMEISVDRSKDREADLFATTARIQAAFEALIRAHPGQWMWGHRRWER